MPAPYNFGTSSEEHLETCHPDCQTILRTLIQFYDVRVVWGWRDEINQNNFYRAGLSTKMFPNSLHNRLDDDGNPRSEAFDIAPWFSTAPHIRWEDAEEFIRMAGRVLQIADMLDMPLIWGGDWDMDGDQHDQRFYDRGHFELVEQL